MNTAIATGLARATAVTASDGKPAIWKLLGSIVIPAHNEATVIGRCLDSLLEGLSPDELDVVVVCNGCTDSTATVARSYGHPVRVMELELGSKTAALRTGDAAALAFPRMYLDADVRLQSGAARLVLARLRAGAIAARPPIVYNSSHCTALVRRYYRGRSRVPAVLGSLWGAGVYGLSAVGRARFRDFPDIVADDLWLDRQFEPGEVEIVECAPVVVAVPRRTRDLSRVLRRTYRGKNELRPPVGPDRRARGTTIATVRQLVRLATSGPNAALDAATYAGFAASARLMLFLPATRADVAQSWERDDSSRMV
jgi:glycosyltransferase involved in cell wall biosynthesis